MTASSIRAELDSLTEDAMRRRLGAKWARYQPPVLAAWVADMDFPVAPPVRRVLADMVARSDFGYPFLPLPKQLIEVFCDRMRSRHGLDIEPERVKPLVTVIQGLDLCVDRFSRPGDGIIVQTPIYPPFLVAVKKAGRRLVENPLVCGMDRYQIDLDHLEQSIDRRTKMLLLCNPHNPSGRVFERAELEALAEIALVHDLIVVADEIHSDLTFDGFEHVSIATLSPEIAARTVTLTSATKSFNLAGLPCAFAAFGSHELLREASRMPPFLLAHAGALAIQATLTAWTEGDDWQVEVGRYLHENRARVGQFLRDRLPEIGYLEPEATYLAWLDCEALVGRTPEPGERASRFFLKKAGVALNCGHDFGPPGAGFVRLNFATSRRILDAVLERMEAAVVEARVKG